MLALALAASVFVVSHFLMSGPPLRAALVARLGERWFRALYSSLAAGLLIWTAIAFARAPHEPLFEPGPLRWLPLVVMPVALLLLVCGLSQKNPTAVEPAAALDDGAAAPGILAVTRHPVMWAFGLWALSHLLANGDLAGMILFGAMAILALGGTLAIDAKKRRSWAGQRWTRFAAATSNLPMLAMIQGRARLRLGEIGWWRVGLALVLYALLLYGHGFVFGVPAISV
jgi:uncharacterized membrane protein